MGQHGKHRSLVGARALLAGAFILSGSAVHACRLALVLAIDVSSSVDPREDMLQRGGLAASLIAPEVQKAFFASSDPVALFVFEWSGQNNQVDLLDWTLIDTVAALTDASNTIAGSRRSSDDYPTAMGYALGYAATRLDTAPNCAAHTIDVAGDGENNDGFGPVHAYNAFNFDGVTVNGLVINAAEYEAETELIPFFRDQVIRGPGAFIEIANGFDDYETAMRRKLVRELSVPVFGAATTAREPKG